MKSRIKTKNYKEQGLVSEHLQYTKDIMRYDALIPMVSTITGSKKGRQPPTTLLKFQKKIKKH